MDKTLKIVLMVSGVMLLCGCLVVGGLAAARVGGVLSGGPGPLGLSRFFGTQSGSFSGTHSVFPGMLLPGDNSDPAFPSTGLLGRLRWLLPFWRRAGSDYPDVYDQLPWGSSPSEYQSGQFFGEIRAWPGIFSQTPGSPSDAAPMSAEQAQQAALEYLSRSELSGLTVGDIILFNNHAYVEIVEKDSGRGAFQVLVDPASLAVGFEPGPSVTWNQKYHLTPGSSTKIQIAAENIPAEMAVSLEQARQAAQRFIELVLPGAEVAAGARPFYGYYTFRLLQDGKLVGLVSVNGSTQAVVPHVWNGAVIEVGED
jgi:hypothetical protein